ncbi:MAG: hypothetical protein QHJ73_14965 [Armatimonadota bacterium]|nr:hypothetical protein [Armatimonadota bacterium]
MDLEYITEIVAALCSSRTVTRLDLRQGSMRLKVRRRLTLPVETGPPVEESAPPAEEGPEPQVIRSHLVGIFHSLGPKIATPVQAGMVVREGQPLGAIESVGMMYDVVADGDGTVLEVLVEDGQPVEYGQELFRVLPASAREEG